MSHRNKKILRMLQKYLLSLGEQIRFKTSHISYGGKIALLGVGISTFSLFQSWIYTNELLVDGTGITLSGASSFSPLVGYIGVLLSMILGYIVFSIVSLRKKEKLYFLGLVRIHESTVCFIGAIIISIASLQCFFFINGLKIFSADILYGKGIIFSLMGAVFIGVGSYYLKIDYKKNTKGSYISELRSGEVFQRKEEEKNNMKLPF